MTRAFPDLQLLDASGTITVKIAVPDGVEPYKGIAPRELVVDYIAGTAGFECIGAVVEGIKLKADGSPGVIRGRVEVRDPLDLNVDDFTPDDWRPPAWVTAAAWCYMPHHRTTNPGRHIAQ